MKVGFFTDSHYSSQEVTCGNRYNSRSLDKIKEAYRFFEKEGCRLAGCPGDLIDKEDHHEKGIFNLKEVVRVRTVFQGHYHEGQRSEHHGVRHITFPAMCEKEKAYFVEEL